jgi:caffeoyl-CoA O-methyltransferase
MDFIDPKLLAYCDQFLEPEQNLLAKLHRETHLKVSSPRMLSGHMQGRILSFLASLVKPRNILEIGTYTGYSALCLAESLGPDGTLITIDPNEETNEFAQRYFDESKYKSRIRLMQGQAKDIIPELKQWFEVVFIDADKKNYAMYFDLVIDIVSPGGIIIADNVLWSGKVLDKNKDSDTQAIHDFNLKVAADDRVTNILLPVRDGLMVMRKK